VSQAIKKKIILASLTLEDICTIFLSEITHPTTHHHIPEDLNTNKTKPNNTSSHPRRPKY